MTRRAATPALTEEIPKPSGRGKPLPYGMNGETSRNGGRAATEGCPPFVNHDIRRAR